MHHTLIPGYFFRYLFKKSYIIDSICIAISLVLYCGFIQQAKAKDTDIYSVERAQNTMILLDNSGSMGFPVYQHNVDYGAMFKYLNAQPGIDYSDYRDGATPFEINPVDRDAIYLMRTGGAKAKIFKREGYAAIAYTGDAGDPSRVSWYENDSFSTSSVLDSSGNFKASEGETAKLSTNAEGKVLFQGSSLPEGSTIAAHDFITLADGTVIDSGFAGTLKAPGYYFSGYYTVSKNSNGTLNTSSLMGSRYENQIVNDAYFFVTGNYINFLRVLNLRDNNGRGNKIWPSQSFPIDTGVWGEEAHELSYPGTGQTYAPNLRESSTKRTIFRSNAKGIRLHFSALDINPTNDTKRDRSGRAYLAPNTGDKLIITDGKNNVIATYDNNNKNTLDSNWSIEVPGNTVHLYLVSHEQNQGAGYVVDKVQTRSTDGKTYTIQTRMQVAQEALVEVVQSYTGKINWGLSIFNNGDGATVKVPLNASDSDDSQRQNMINQINKVTSGGGTPLMEALQDVFRKGFYGNTQLKGNKKLKCRKNYVISMTDGFPSVDTDSRRLGSETSYRPEITDFDGDGWTGDLTQRADPNYYDDVAHWMYTHSWREASSDWLEYKNPTVITNPANSYDNIITHHISFGAKHPLLENAASESGGKYIPTGNKEQILAAFNSLAMEISNNVSFTAPVVSVDSVNKIQSGDDLYMGLFLPEEQIMWSGNVKKFKLGDGSKERPNKLAIYDAANKMAEDAQGRQLDNTAAFWGDDDDANDSDNYGGADIKEDGAGEVMLESLQKTFAAGNYWTRPIYTYKNGSMTKFDRTITPAELGVSDDATRDKLVNFVHGYTYDAAAKTGAPQAVRPWILGSIIHSRPTVIDYFDTSDPKLPLTKRLVAVGSNDGMLHIFDDADGKELFAFIPSDILPSLQHTQTNDLYETVDGPITLYRKEKNPTYLIFGERRGGNAYWCLDISNPDPTKWAVKWQYTNQEISQTWSDVRIAKIPVDVDKGGKITFKDVAIFTGGYAPEEDNYPEPFNDANMNGIPEADEWSKNNPLHDLNGNGVYDKYNPESNTSGRGLFVVDIDDPTKETSINLDGTETNTSTGTQAVTMKLLPFSAIHPPDKPSMQPADQLPGSVRTSLDLKYCFPSAPSVITGAHEYSYTDLATPGTIKPTRYAREENVLLAFYATDIYANVYKVGLNFGLTNLGTNASPGWVANRAETGWILNKIFSANPGSTSQKAGMRGQDDENDQGRKTFYGPEVSWGGTKGYFNGANYVFPGTTFLNRKYMATLFFGTGDREHPRYRMIRNRFYAIYDDSWVRAELKDSNGSILWNNPVGTMPYAERHLMNLSCDELGKNSTITGCYITGAPCTKDNAAKDMPAFLKKILRDDAVYPDVADPAKMLLEPQADGTVKEDDFKGWYIVFDDQGQRSKCGHMSYATSIDADLGSDRDNHLGEQMLSQPLLYAGILYFTSYQAGGENDDCSPRGNAFTYSINYQDGTAAYDYNKPRENKWDITDRWNKFRDIGGIPSSFTLLVGKDYAAAIASVGDVNAGPGSGRGDDDGGGGGGGGGECDPNDPNCKPEPECTPGDPGCPRKIKQPGGLDLYYWRDSNSLQNN